MLEQTSQLRHQRIQSRRRWPIIPFDRNRDHREPTFSRNELRRQMELAIEINLRNGFADHLSPAGSSRGGEGKIARTLLMLAILRLNAGRGRSETDQNDWRLSLHFSKYRAS